MKNDDEADQDILGSHYSKENTNEEDEINEEFGIFSDVEDEMGDIMSEGNLKNAQ